MDKTTNLKELKKEYNRIKKELEAEAKSTYRTFNFLYPEQTKSLYGLADKLEKLSKQIEELEK